MNTLLHLRNTLEGLAPADFERRKPELLALVDNVLSPAPDHSGGNGNGNGNGHRRLSPREDEVMKMILEGRRLKEIAATLDISVKTVTTHRARLLRKLGLEDNLGLYRYGIRKGIIQV